MRSNILALSCLTTESVKYIPLRRQASADIYGGTESTTSATQSEPEVLKVSRLPHKKPVFFLYRIADRAVKPCRSSRSTTHGGMVKSPLTLAKQGNKQTKAPQTKTSKTKPNKNTTKPTNGKCQGKGDLPHKKPRRQICPLRRQASADYQNSHSITLSWTLQGICRITRINLSSVASVCFNLFNQRTVSIKPTAACIFTKSFLKYDTIASNVERSVRSLRAPKI